MKKLRDNTVKDRANLIQRDYYVTFFPLIRSEWVQDELN